ncbi:MBL fold metallo-hydrolase [Rhizobium sp. SSA_523]|uniref:MBL fold metallo-hydrolase n=1 Tax=Rhizobium sp. SSA_523 TaxID=2952477 RepID=UPI002090CF53|nr:MBL fold metallo-hydrolase [Rhizobium sp. SSA_523]MCO5731007.1 MBL fold metallo-hydrolase [Rhizobium sp. SSA_523]WKC24188.1 MBL fold metallo-hydrolase [Rhizobium sp. SSA_523]
MSDAPEFDLSFEASYGDAVCVAEGVWRVTCHNPSPFTFRGTNSYIVGRGKDVAVIDPGPEDDAHFETLMRALKGRTVSHILISHTHRDHSPLAARLKAETGALTAAEGPHRASRPLHQGEENPFAESSDYGFQPDIVLADGASVQGDGFTLTAIHTPGHAANHSAFALEETGILFSADHVMAWATTIVAPPDGSMADFMASLDKLIARDAIDRIYFPGHGGPISDPPAFLRGLRTHRRMRERAIFERVRAGDAAIADIVRTIYARTDSRLHPAAALSVLAHLEDLVERGDVITEGPPGLSSRYRAA